MAENNPGKYKVALASSDGENVDRHYGRADTFFIYLIDDDEGYDLVEKRKLVPVCMEGSHVQSSMEESTLHFSDCRYVAASRIGNGAASLLSSKGITAMELPGTVEEAILKIWKYNRIQGLFN